MGGMSADGKAFGSGRKRVKRREGEAVGIAAPLRPFLRSEDSSELIDVDDGLYNFLSPKLLPTLVRPAVFDSTLPPPPIVVNEGYDSLASGGELALKEKDKASLFAEESLGTELSPLLSLAHTHVKSYYYERPSWFARGDDLQVLLAEAGRLDWAADPGTAVPAVEEEPLLDDRASEATLYGGGVGSGAIKSESGRPSNEQGGVTAGVSTGNGAAATSRKSNMSQTQGRSSDIATNMNQTAASSRGHNAHAAGNSLVMAGPNTNLHPYDYEGSSGINPHNQGYGSSLSSQAYPMVNQSYAYMQPQMHSNLPCDFNGSAAVGNNGSMGGAYPPHGHHDSYSMTNASGYMYRYSDSYTRTMAHAAEGAVSGSEYSAAPAPFSYDRIPVYPYTHPTNNKHMNMNLNMNVNMNMQPPSKLPYTDYSTTVPHYSGTVSLSLDSSYSPANSGGGQNLFVHTMKLKLEEEKNS